jgi:hypothetical protein
VRSYYHLVPLVCYYYSVGYMSDSVDYSSSSLLECFTDVGVFPCFYRLTGKHLALLTNVVSRFKSFSEAPRLAQKCGIGKSVSPVRTL